MNTAQNSTTLYPSSNEILGDDISVLAAQIHAATYRFLVMIREFDRREAWAEFGLKSCAQWLNWRCGISLHTGREKVRVAHALSGLDKISTAFEHGQLSYSKVRALTRVANSDNEDLLLNIALSGTAAQLERLVRCEIRSSSEDEVEANTKQAFENRYFTWQEQHDGSVSFHGSLPAELAAKLIAAIESFEKIPETEEVINSDNNDGNVPVDVVRKRDWLQDSVVGAASSRDQRLNQLDVNRGKMPLQRESSRFHTTSAETLPKTAKTVGAKRADALVALTDKCFDGYQVVLHVPAGTSSKPITLGTAGTIPYAAAQRICCDAAIVPVIEDESGRLLEIGRKTRKIPPAMRRALELRDRSTCRFPGCTHTRHLHGHHIEHWAHGGKTCLDNLVLLCSHHHGLVHEGGYSCAAIKGNGQKGPNIVFHAPSGVVLPDVFQLEPSSGSIEENQQHLEINAGTCEARDFGQRFNVGTVIDAMQFIRKHSQDIP